MIISMSAIDSLGRSFSVSFRGGTQQPRMVYFSYFSSYSHRIVVGVTSLGLELHISVIPINDYLRMINNQTWSPCASTIISQEGSFEFIIGKRGYHVILIDLRGDFNGTGYSLYYSFERTVQDDLVSDGLPLLTLGAILLALSYVMRMRR